MPITDSDFMELEKPQDDFADLESRWASDKVQSPTAAEIDQMAATLPSAATTESQLHGVPIEKQREDNGIDFDLAEIATRFGKGFAHGVVGITSSAVYPFSPEISAEMQKDVDVNYPLPRPGIAGTVGNFAGSAAVSLPAVVASAAGAPLTSLGLLAAGTSLYGAAGAGNMLQRLDQHEAETGKKFTQAQRVIAATAAAAIDGGLEALGIHWGVNRIVKSMAPQAVEAFTEALIHKNTSFVTGIIKSALVEAGEEVSEDALKDVVASAYVGNEAYDNALQRYTMSGLGGAVGGGMMAGAGGAVQRLRPQPEHQVQAPPVASKPSEAVEAALQAANKPIKVEAPTAEPVSEPPRVAKPAPVSASMSIGQALDSLINTYGFTNEQIQAREEIIANQKNADSARTLFQKPKRTARQRALDAYSMMYIDNHTFEAQPAAETVVQKEEKAPVAPQPITAAEEVQVIVQSSPSRMELISKYKFTEKELAGFEKIIDEKETKDAALNQWSGKLSSKRQRALQRYMLNYIETKGLPLMEEGKDYWFGGVSKKGVVSAKAAMPPIEAAPVLQPPSKPTPSKTSRVDALEPVTLERSIIANGGLHPDAVTGTLESWAAAHQATVDQVLAAAESLVERGILDKQGNIIEWRQPQAIDEATEHLNSMMAEGHSEQSPKDSRAEARMKVADAAVMQLHEAGFGFTTIKQHYRKFLHGAHYVDNPKLITAYTAMLIRNKEKAQNAARTAVGKRRAENAANAIEAAKTIEEPAASIEAQVEPESIQAESTDDAAILEQLIKEQSEDDTNIVTSTFDSEMDEAEQQTFAERRTRRNGRRKRNAPERGLSDADIDDMISDYQKRPIKEMMGETLQRRATETYGTTSDPLNAGFLLPDGTMIKRGPKGFPSKDGDPTHAAAAKFIGAGTSGPQAMDTLAERHGWIRLNADIPAVDVGKAPTDIQIGYVRDFLKNTLARLRPSALIGNPAVAIILRGGKQMDYMDLRLESDIPTVLRRLRTYYAESDQQIQAAKEPPLHVQREASLVHDLVTPLFKSGLIHGVELVNGPITNPQNGQEANAAIFHFPDGRSVMRLGEHIELNTIGHEGAHSLIRRLGTNHPYVDSITRLFGDDIEAACDAIGDVFYGRVTLPQSMYTRLVRWLRGLWTQAELTLGRTGSQQAILDGLVDYMTRDKPVKPMEQIRAEWEAMFRQREKDFQTTSRQQGEKKMLDFLDGPGRDFYRTTLKMFENQTRPPWAETDPRREAEKYMNARSMTRIMTLALRGQAVTPAELHALASYTELATQELQKAVGSTTDVNVINGLHELSQPFIIAFELASSMQGRGLEILKHRAEIRPKTMSEWILKSESLLQRKLSKLEKERLFKSSVNWNDPVEAAIEMQKHTKVTANELFKWAIATNWLSGTAIPTNFVLNLSKMLYFNTEALISASVNEAVSAVTFGKVQRQRVLTELIPRLRAQYAGLKQGAAAAGKIIANKAVDPNSRAYLDLGIDAISVWKKIARQTKSPILRGVAEAIDFGPGIFLRAMSAGDIMVRGAYYMDSLAQQCLSEAREKGLHQGTADFEAFVRSWKEGPEHKALAKAAAADGVFMGPAGKILGGIKNVRDGMGMLGTYLMPFMHTIGKVMEYGYNRVPLVPLATSKLAQGTIARPGETWSDVAARQIFGAVMLAMLIAWMDKDKDHFVGAIPESPGERDAFWRRGVAPWSIGSPELGYLSVDRDPHFAILKTAMLAKQAIDKAQSDPNAFKSSLDVFAWATNKATNELLRDSMFGGIVQPLSGPGATGKFIADVPANLVPLKGMFHAASRMYEAAAYGMVHIKDRSGVINQIEPDPLRRTVAHAFGNTGDLPDKLTVWGTPMVVRTSLLNEWLPYKVWQPSSEPLEQELHRMAQVEPTFQYPGFAAKEIKIGQKEIKLPDDIYRQHLLWSGSLLKDYYQRAMATKLYQSPRTTDQVRATILRKIDAKVGDAALKKVKAEIVLHHKDLLQ